MERPKILLIDNYDSFVWNLAQYLYIVGADVDVQRNDVKAANAYLSDEVDGLVLSPGPCTPNEAGHSIALIQEAAKKDLPTLGVCLGHQAIVMAFEGHIGAAKDIRHGKISEVRHKGGDLFHDIPPVFDVVRYHSLAALNDGFPTSLRATAFTEDGEIMAIQHQTLPIYGVQFHPESIQSAYGLMILENWLAML